jgi:hypothetical protein
MEQTWAPYNLNNKSGVGVGDGDLSARVKCVTLPNC